MEILGRWAEKHAQSHAAQVSHVYRSALIGYAATIPSARVASLRADEAVLFVSPDEEVQIAGQTLGTGVNQINAESKPNKRAGSMSPCSTPE